MTNEIGSHIDATVTELRNDHVLLSSADGVECFLGERDLVFRKGEGPAKALAGIKVGQSFRVEVLKEVKVGDKTRLLVSAFKVVARERQARRAHVSEILAALRAGQGFPAVVKSKKPGMAYCIVDILDEAGQPTVNGLVPANLMEGDSQSEKRNRCDMVTEGLPLPQVFLVEEKIKEGRVHRTFSQFSKPEDQRKIFADDEECQRALDVARSQRHAAPVQHESAAEEDGHADAGEPPVEA